MNKKWLQTKNCKCGCGTLINKYGSNGSLLFYVKGHQPHAKSRPDMIGNNWGGNQEYFKTHKFCDEKHHRWKGDSVGYDALHRWVAKKLGKPNTCEKCHQSGFNRYQIHWANKSRTYKRELSDWLRLCAKCHYHYDRK